MVMITAVLVAEVVTERGGCRWRWRSRLVVEAEVDHEKSRFLLKQVQNDLPG